MNARIRRVALGLAAAVAALETACVAAGLYLVRAFARLHVEGLLHAEDGREPVMRGTGLRIGATSPATIVALPPSDFAGRIELGQAEVPQLTVLNQLLPGGAGLRVTGGSARAEGAFDVTDGGRSCNGVAVGEALGHEVVVDRSVLRWTTVLVAHAIDPARGSHGMQIVERRVGDVGLSRR